MIGQISKDFIHLKYHRVKFSAASAGDDLMNNILENLGKGFDIPITSVLNAQKKKISVCKKGLT